MGKIFRFIYIYLKLIQLDLDLIKNGVPQVFEKYVEKYEPIDIKNYKTHEIQEINRQIMELIVLIETVCVFYPKNARCIHKSFLSYRILREKYKIPLKLVIGVCHFPFSAHAWIMQGKYNIGEDEVDTNRYKVILDSSNYLKGENSYEMVHGKF